MKDKPGEQKVLLCRGTSRLLSMSRYCRCVIFSMCDFSKCEFKRWGSCGKEKLDAILREMAVWVLFKETPACSTSVFKKSVNHNNMFRKNREIKREFLCSIKGCIRNVTRFLSCAKETDLNNWLALILSYLQHIAQLVLDNIYLCMHMATQSLPNTLTSVHG